jgi:hypothetical protein
MQIHLHEVKFLQIHNARLNLKKNITAINQSESSIFIQGVINPFLRNWKKYDFFGVKS